MKKASLIKQLIRLTGMLLGICDSHHSSLLAISASYRVLEPESSDSHDPVNSIKIKPCGALYQLSHMNSHDDGVPARYAEASYQSLERQRTFDLFRPALLLDPGRGKKG